MLSVHSNYTRNCILVQLYPLWTLDGNKYFTALCMNTTKLLRATIDESTVGFISGSGSPKGVRAVMGTRQRGWLSASRANSLMNIHKT